MIPPSIRLLPMTSDIPSEFEGCTTKEDVQNIFFLSELPSRECGKYSYRKRGLNTEPGTIVLFQCQATVIASATFIGAQRYEQQNDGGYDGHLNFDVSSIMTFTPLGADAIKEIWPNFKGFNQSRQELDPGNYPEFTKRLECVRQPNMLSSGYLPTKTDVEAAYRMLARLGESVSLDAVLDQIDMNARQAGYSLKHNWRIITEENIISRSVYPHS